MKPHLPLVLFGLTEFCFPSRCLRVMTFNTWWFGKNVLDGYRKIAQHLLLVDPDIAVLQEYIWPVSGDIRVLLSLLGDQWHGALGGGRTFSLRRVDDDTFKRHLILSKFPFINDSFVNVLPHAVGIRTRLPISWNGHPKTVDVNIWNVHLDAANMGPDLLCMDQVTDVLKTEIVRLQECLELIAVLSKTADPETPLIVAGDLNSASHLDWTPEASQLHCGRVQIWPVTKALEKYGLIDSYRQLHPDPAIDPGMTWSTVETRSPQDRIDYILYKPANRLFPYRSFTYGGIAPNQPTPWHYLNAYPSDHYAVVTDFWVV